MLKDEELKYLVQDDSGVATKTYKEYTGKDEEPETEEEKEFEKNWEKNMVIKLCSETTVKFIGMFEKMLTFDCENVNIFFIKI